MNYFPAAPLVSVTLVLEGALHVSDGQCDLDTLRKLTPISARHTQGPTTQPQVSWSPGPLYALTVAFFPEAWRRLNGSAQPRIPEAIAQSFDILETKPLPDAWPAFWSSLSTAWQAR